MPAMTQIPSLAQLLKQAIENRLLDVHTALIAKVESYDAKKQRANVSPVLKRQIKNMEGKWVAEQLPILCDVPVLFPRSGGFFLHFPIRPGDFVQLIFNEVNVDEWLENTKPMIACNQRFSLQGAIAIPGIYPSVKALTDAHEDNLVLGKERGLQIHIDGKKIRLGSADASQALAIASKVKAELEKIRTAFNSHIHASSTSPPTQPTISLSSDLGLITPLGNIATHKVVAE
jgi:hypothetical protein